MVLFLAYVSRESLLCLYSDGTLHKPVDPETLVFEMRYGLNLDLMSTRPGLQLSFAVCCSIITCDGSMVKCRLGFMKTPLHFKHASTDELSR